MDMDWLIKNSEWIFSGIGVHALDIIYTLVIAAFSFFFVRKKIKPVAKKIAKVFVIGSGNKTNINQ